MRRKCSSIARSWLQVQPLNSNPMKSYVRSKIDKRVQALVCMTEGCKNLPEYTLGEVLYTSLRRASRAYGGDIRFLREIDTDTLLRCIEQSLDDEVQDNNS